MNMLKLITAITLAATLMVIAMPSTASANTMEQKQKLEQEIECTVSGYGQSTCKAKQVGEQEQKQTVCLYRNGKCIQVHNVVNTGLDGITLFTLASTIVTGAGAAVLKIKSLA